MPEPDIGLSDAHHRALRSTGETFAWFNGELVVIRYV